MTDAYVSSISGNNANNGLSSGAPKATLSAAIAIMGGAGTLFMERGSTFSIADFAIPFTGITIDAYGSGIEPKLQTAGGFYGLEVNKGCTLKNIFFTGAGFLIHMNTTQTVVFDHLRLENYGSPNGNGPGTAGQGIRVSQYGDWTISNCNIDNTANQANASDQIYFELGSGNGGVGRGPFKCFGNTFKGAGFNSGDHMHLNDIWHADIYNNYFGPMSSGKGAIITQFGAGNVKIHDNTFDQCGNYCWALGTVTNAECYNNFFIGVQGANWSECIRFAYEDGLTPGISINVHDNTFVNCRRPIGVNDMYTFSNVDNVLIEHNTFVDPQGVNPKWLDISAPGPSLANWRIRWNLIRNSAAAVIAVSMPGLVFDDNWYENTPTSGTNPKTGNAGLDTNYKPTNPAASALPYGARTNVAPPNNRPPPPTNTITGNSGVNDTLTAPVLAAGTLLNGLSGNDTYAMQPGMGPSEVAWFTRSPPVEQDLLDVSAFGYTTFSQFQANVTMEPIPGGTYADVPWDVLIIHFNAQDSVWLNSVLTILQAEVILAPPPVTPGQPTGARRRNTFTYGSEGVT